MAIEHSNGSTILTGGHTLLMRYASIKMGLQIEKRGNGMVLTRGWRRSKFAAELGVKPRASVDEYLKAVEAKIAAVNSAASAQDAADAALARGDTTC